MEELVEVTVLMDGLMPYAGYTPVMAAVWDTHAAGSMGRIGSPVESNAGCAVTAGDLTRAAHQKRRPCMRLQVWMLLQWKWEKGNKRKKHLLLGRAKQLRGFGSQHLATVRVMGLVTNKEARNRFNLLTTQIHSCACFFLHLLYSRLF